MSVGRQANPAKVDQGYATKGRVSRTKTDGCCKDCKSVIVQHFKSSHGKDVGDEKSHLFCSLGKFVVKPLAGCKCQTPKE